MSLLPEQEYIVDYLMNDVLNLDIINSNVCLDNKYRFCFGTKILEINNSFFQNGMINLWIIFMYTIFLSIVFI